jgi:hypothetical protein
MTDGAMTSDLLPAELPPEAAGARLAELRADPAWIERYLQGEVKANEEARRLHSLASKAPANPEGIHRSTQISALQRVADLPPEAWRQIENNMPVFEGERAFALQEKERCFRDSGFVKRWLDGDRAAVSHLTRLSLIIASPTKPEGN